MAEKNFALLALRPHSSGSFSLTRFTKGKRPRLLSFLRAIPLSPYEHKQLRLFLFVCYYSSFCIAGLQEGRGQTTGNKNKKTRMDPRNPRP